MTKPPTSVRSIRLPDGVWAKLKAEAEAAGVSLNAHIAGICDQPRARRDVPVISTQGGFEVGDKITSAAGGDLTIVAVHPKPKPKFQPIDPLTGKPLEPRRPMQKGQKR